MRLNEWEGVSYTGSGTKVRYMSAKSPVAWLMLFLRTAGSRKETDDGACGRYRIAKPTVNRPGTISCPVIGR